MDDYLSTSILEVTKQLVDDYKPVKTRDLGLGSQVASCYLSHSLFGKAFLCKVATVAVELIHIWEEKNSWHVSYMGTKWFVLIREWTQIWQNSLKIVQGESPISLFMVSWAMIIFTCLQKHPSHFQLLLYPVYVKPTL